MTEHRGYNVAVYHDDELVERFTTNCLPYPGLVLALNPDTWKVERVMLQVPRPGSAPLRDGNPWLVDVIATPTPGIHA